MKHILIRSLATLLFVASASLLHGQITIGNIRAAQRPGTKLVDIDYDLTGIATPCKVWLEISGDGGTTWAVPTASAAGAVGTNITPGANLRITWDMGVDWNGQYSAQTRFRVKADDLANFAFIPAGNFQMGDALDGQSNAPVHTVNVSAFYMQKIGVTKAEWDSVRAWGLTHEYTDLAAGAGKAAGHPVQNISWYDAVKWCNAHSQMEGLTPCYYTDAAQTVVFKTGSTDIDNTMVKWAASGYRLPTEAEREKAARGGLNGKRFPWGDIINHSFANYLNGSQSYESPQNQGYHPTYAVGATPYTSPVGSFAANSFGIYDMAGNVREWCWDWFDASYYASSPTTDPVGPLGSTRVLRGGYWAGGGASCRVASRDNSNTVNKGTGIGFRPVRR
jgi:formylglycine-generating enzyme required for sulfatase activity